MTKFKVLPASLSEVHSDIIRMHKSEHDLVSAGQFILVRCGGVETVMTYRGALERQKRGTVRIDHHNRGILNLEIGDLATLGFAKPSWCQIGQWAWRAPDVATRIAFKLSIISIALGIVGAFLGLVSLFNV